MSTKSVDSSSLIINSVDRTFDILEFIYKQGGDVAISQISKDLDIYKSTVYRTLVTLESRGYIIQDTSTERYSIGPKLYAFAPVNEQSKEELLIQTVRPYMQKLSDKYGDTVSLGILKRDSTGIYAIALIDDIEATNTIGVKHDLSVQSECYCASLGKCLLAFSKDVDLSVYKNHDMKKFTNNTITTYGALKSELDDVRAKGYALDDEEREEGLKCIGIPLISNGYSIAAISLSGPTFRMNDEHFHEKTEFMLNLGKEITQNAFM